MKPSVYIESSVISYLVARPSQSVVVAGHQATTAAWWERSLPEFQPFVSLLVVEEISAGDPAEAHKRLQSIEGFAVLRVPQEARALASEYFDASPLPERARADAVHVALATHHGMDCLVTWNCRHIANEKIRAIVRGINERHGLATPEICTPEEHLELADG